MKPLGRRYNYSPLYRGCGIIFVVLLILVLIARTGQSPDEYDSTHEISSSTSKYSVVRGWKGLKKFMSYKHTSPLYKAMPTSIISPAFIGPPTTNTQIQETQIQIQTQQNELSQPQQSPIKQIAPTNWDYLPQIVYAQTPDIVNKHTNMDFEVKRVHCIYIV
jgi:hypothetical protein